MKVFTILAHAEELSFSAGMFRAAAEVLREAGHEVQCADLYRIGFDPVSDRRNFTTAKDPGYVKQQIEEMHASEGGGFAADLEDQMRLVEWCDLMLWQFPLWWFGLPAILKGWVDRVFAMGRFYGGGRHYGSGVLRGKRALLSVTTGGPEQSYAPDGRNGDIHGILRPIQRGVLQFTGFDVLAPHIVYAPAHQSDAQRREALDAYARRLRALEDEDPVDVGRY